MKEGKIPQLYFTHLLSLDASQLDDIPGVEVLDTVEERGISLVEVTSDKPIIPLLRVRRSGYSLSHVRQKPELVTSEK